LIICHAFVRQNLAPAAGAIEAACGNDAALSLPWLDGRLSYM
jgi:hypothetical protein